MSIIRTHGDDFFSFFSPPPLSLRKLYILCQIIDLLVNPLNVISTYQVCLPGVSFIVSFRPLTLDGSIELPDLTYICEHDDKPGVLGGILLYLFLKAHLGSCSIGTRVDKTDTLTQI